MPQKRTTAEPSPPTTGRLNFKGLATADVADRTKVELNRAVSTWAANLPTNIPAMGGASEYGKLNATIITSLTTMLGTVPGNPQSGPVSLAHGNGARGAQQVAPSTRIAGKQCKRAKVTPVSALCETHRRQQRDTSAAQRATTGRIRRLLMQMDVAVDNKDEGLITMILSCKNTHLAKSHIKGEPLRG